MKKKIIIYGISNTKLRSMAISYLDDDYEILGVSDSFLHEDVLQNEQFISPNHIINCSFDYIVLLIWDEEKRKKVLSYLQFIGIERSKIVEPVLFLLNQPEYIPNLIEEIYSIKEKSIETLVMGLSYSLRGLDYSMFYGGIIDLSWHGQDLYYNLKLYSELKKNKELHDSIKTILMVFPYYYFNYDMSLSLYQYSSGQIFANRGLQDWHNAINGSDDVKEYIKCQKLFGNKFWKNKRWRKVQPDNYNIALDEKVTLDDIWKKIYEDTWRENILIFYEFIKITNKNVLVVIPPVLLHCIKDKEFVYYNEMKTRFYRVLEECSDRIEIYDFSDAINDNSLFYDYEHLNNSGRLAFTELLIKKIESANK